MVFFQGQRLFIIKHYFLTKLRNKFRQQYEKQCPGAILSINKVCEFENEYSVDDATSWLVDCSNCREESESGKT